MAILRSLGMENVDNLKYIKGATDDRSVISL